MAGEKPRIGTILIGQGVITQADLDTAVTYQLRTESVDGRARVAGVTGGRIPPRPLRLGEVLVLLNLCTEADIARAIAQQQEIPYLDLDAEPPAAGIAAALPEQAARRCGVVPVRMEGDRLRAAPRDAANTRLRAILEESAGRPVEFASVPESQVAAWIERVYGVGGAEQAEAGFDAGRDLSPAALLRRLMEEAVRRGATNLYLDPAGTGVEAQLQIYGRLHPLAALPETDPAGLIRELRRLGNCSTGAGNPAETSRARLWVGGRLMEVEISVLPGDQGWRGVMRFGV